MERIRDVSCKYFSHQGGLPVMIWKEHFERIFVFHRTYSTTKFDPDRDIQDVFFSV